METQVKEIVVDFIKLIGGYQKRKQLFLEDTFHRISLLKNTFGEDVFKILNVNVIKTTTGLTSGYIEYPKLTYYINNNGQTTKIKGAEVHIKHTYKNNKLIESNSVNSVRCLDKFDVKTYDFNYSRLTKSYSKKQYFYDKKGKVKRTISTTRFNKGNPSFDKYLEVWVKNGVPFNTIGKSTFISNLNFFLWYKLKSSKYFKWWKQIGEVIFG